MPPVSVTDRLLTSVAAAARAREDVHPDIAVDLARVAVRRLTEDDLRRVRIDELAGELADGAALLASRGAGTAVAVHDRPDATVVQLACIDRPFLLSSVLDTLERDGHHVRLQLYPIVGTVRGAAGRLEALAPARDAEHRETLLHLEVVPSLPAEERATLPDHLHAVVDDVVAATDGFPAMRRHLEDHAAQLRVRTLFPDARDASPDEGADGDGHPDRDPTDDAAEVADLLDWLLDEHAVLLGTRRYRLLDAAHTPLEEGGGPAVWLQVDPDAGAGLLADPGRSRYAEPTSLQELAATPAGRFTDLPLLTWSRSRRRSIVQRRVRMEHLALAERDADGRMVAVVRVLLLLTRAGEDAQSAQTPVLRERFGAVLRREDVVPGSHDDLVLTARFQALPKDELFPLDVPSTRRLLLDLLQADVQRDVRLWMRTDPVTRTVSVLVAVPRDEYSPQLRDRIVEHLRARFDADRTDVRVVLDDRGAAVARVLLTLEHDLPEVAGDELQTEIRQLARDWIAEVRELLEMRDGPSEAQRLLATFARQLPRSYRETVDPAVAAADLRLLDRAASRSDHLAIAWHRDVERGRWRLRTVVRDAPLELSSFLPILESLGLIVADEVPYHLPGEVSLHLHDVGVRVGPVLDRALSDAGARERASAAIDAAWRGLTEVDRLGQLVVLTTLRWQEVGVLRAYRRYRRQLGSPLTPAYVEQILVAHAPVTGAVLRRFRARFDPALGEDRTQALAEADAAFEEAMTAVTRLDADRVLRGLSRLIDATVRTNAFRTDAVTADGVPYVALKFDPVRIGDVPPPVLHREVFVHSPQLEGVHLRAGPVARGGLRWSDRRDDVRTEVLGLVKAQVLKNALIVPTGAKGGFVLADPPEDGEALRAAVAEQYVTFIRGLLDVTDDLDTAADGTTTLVPPPQVVRHDGDDPYLVVAADKGTAALSDTANGVAQARGFWLGDAFASGGSAGYDHKALGVTAKGAWRAVARHFRELGVDPAVDPVTVAGVGDMSGDVFSNGLLRSRSVRLVAAFDHRHVFLDPTPDPDASFEERTRLAALPRSSWDDYDRAVLSPGAMIVGRDVRSVTLTDEVRELLRLEDRELTPPELVRAILSAPVDLLWAGGIGTYLKASTERHDEVGDRTNDEVRVDADQVRARVIGEGANLFVTQRARIELSRRGSRVDQDAIHNAAGVATSDAEVNLKILLDLAIADGRLAADDRDAALASLADEVVASVLDAVDRQVAALSAEVARSHHQLDELDAFVQRLERTAGLDRDVEVLPSAEELTARARAGGGLTRPELATLLAWAKRELKESLLESAVPDDPVVVDAVTAPFPPAAVERFGDLLPRHRLRRELVATAVANTCVDRLGITFVSGLADATGVTVAEVARAVRIAIHVVDAHRWWDATDALEGTLPPERVRELSEVIAGLVRELTAALLDDPRVAADPQAVRDEDRQVAERLLAHGSELGSVAQRRARTAHVRWLVDDLVPPDLAQLIASAPDLGIVPDVARTARELATDRPVEEIADVAFRLAEVLGIERLLETLRRVPPGEGWARRHHRVIAEELRRVRREAATTALRDTEASLEPAKVVAELVADRRARVDQARRTVQAVSAEHGLDGIAVAVRAVWVAVG